MKKAILAAAIAATALPAMPVNADPPPWSNGRHHDWERNDYRGDRYRDRHYYRDYRLSRNDRIWRGRDGRYYCHRSDGTTGLVIGAAVGTIIGRSLDDGRDRTLGTILGLTGGALLGRSIDRGDLHCR